MNKEEAVKQQRKKCSTRWPTISSILNFYGYKWKSCLYVGAHHKRFEQAERIKKVVSYMDLLEIWLPNVEYLKKNIETTPFRNIIQGDVRRVQKIVKQKYDLVMWWHGPEHIPQEEIPATVKHIKKVTNKVIILGCPWGVYEQGAAYGNPHEEHRCHLHPEFFQKMGLLTTTVSQPGHKLGHITAWMDVNW